MMESQLDRLLKKIRQSLRGELVRHTAIMAGSHVIRLGIQAGYFIIIARVLGVEGYGLFMGLLALAEIASPFVTWGSDHVLVRNVSRDRASFGLSLGTSIMLCIILGITFSFICFWIGKATLPAESTSVIVILSILLSELVAKSIRLPAYSGFLAIGNIKACAVLTSITSFKNFLAALVLISIPLTFDRLEMWSILYAVSTLLASLASLGFAVYKIGKPVFSISNLRRYEFKEGFYFSINQSAGRVNTNLDKTMLASLSTLDGTGIYAAAYRIIEIAAIPIDSLMAAAYPKFFVAGAKGISSALDFGKRVLIISGSFGILITLVIPLVAPVVPLILGEEYRASVEAMRWLAPTVLLVSLNLPIADILTGSGYQGIRSAIEISTALINFFANLVLIPLYSWKGAAWATLISYGLALATVWTVVFCLYQVTQRREAKKNKKT